jgi:hypothetical protein
MNWKWRVTLYDIWQHPFYNAGDIRRGTVTRILDSYWYSVYADVPGYSLRYWVARLGNAIFPDAIERAWVHICDVADATQCNLQTDSGRYRKELQW